MSEQRPRVRLIRRVAALRSVVRDWDTFLGADSSPMQQSAWTTAAAETFSRDGELRVLIADDRALAPLVSRLGRLERWELPGARELYEPLDFVYRDRAGLEALAWALARCGAPLHLERIFADSPLIAALERAYQGHGVLKVRPKPGCPWIALGPPLADAEQLLSSRRRSDLRRARRRAEEQGALKVEIVSPRAAEVPALLDEAFAVEAASWKGRSGTALSGDALRADFFRRYAVAAAEQGSLRLGFLRIGDRAAAMQIAVECGGAYWVLKIGYDERFARESPGMLLMLETIRYAMSHGLTRYELLGAVAPWTEMWTDKERGCVSITAYPYSPRGMVALARHLTGIGARRLKDAARERRAPRADSSSTLEAPAEAPPSGAPS